MYRIDENGFPVSDPNMSNRVTRATRDRLLSPRAAAMTSMDITKIRASSLLGREFSSQLVFKTNEILSQVYSVANPHSRARSNGAYLGTGEIEAVLSKLMVGLVKYELQGFPGALPVSYDGNRIQAYFPADGAVIRYLSRAMANNPFPDLFNLAVLPVSQGEQFSSIDGSVCRSSNLHIMKVTCEFGFTSGTVYTAGMTNSLHLTRRVLEIQQIIYGLRKVMTVLTRKLISSDGSYGELPKFPIVNFGRKVSPQRITPGVRISMHGNNKGLFGDKSIYQVLPFGEKAPLISSSGIKGREYQWIRPKQ